MIADTLSKVEAAMTAEELAKAREASESGSL
jgi:hypothetical protein